MANKRKGISPSLRWTVFSRDSFTCRYCGAQAGQEGVELHVDHIVSVLEGGDNRLDNLATACQKCNGGKGAKCLSTAPTNERVIQRIDDQAEKLRQQAISMQAVLGAQKELAQMSINLKCEAYGVDSVRMNNHEEARITELCRQYGADRVLEWYKIAARHRVSEWNAIKYVSGIIRRKRDEGEFDAQ